MKLTRSMVLVSNDPESLRRGAAEIYQSFFDELAAADLSEQVALSHIPDSGRPDILPMVIIYPEWKQTDVPPVPYPPCVESQGTDNVAVTECCLVKTTQRLLQQQRGQPGKC